MPASIPSSRARRALVPPSFALARKQLRQTGGLLLFMGLSLVVSVALAGMLPQYTQVAQVAEFDAAVHQDTARLNITLTLDGLSITPDQYQNFTAIFQHFTQPYIGPYMTMPPRTTVEIQDLPIADTKSNGQFYATTNDITLYGTGTGANAPPVQIVAGRMPVAQSDVVEIAMLPADVQAMNLHLGDTITVRYASTLDAYNVTHDLYMPLRLVGIIQPQQPDDPFWQTYSLNAVEGSFGGHFYALASQATALAVFTQLTNQAIAKPEYFTTYMVMQWIYRIDPDTLSYAHLGDVLNNLQALTLHLPDARSLGTSSASILRIDGPLTNSDNFLARYQQQSVAAQLPIAVLLAGLIVVVIFFVSVLAELAIERQNDTIGTLRSRGFSRWQIVQVLALPMIGLCVLVLAGGMALSWPLLHLLAQRQFSPTDRGVAAALNADPRALLVGIFGYAAMTVGAALLAALLAILRATQLDVLALRREATRARQGIIWQVLRLDVIVAIVCLVAAAIALYVKTSIAGLNPQIDALLTPIAVLAPVLVVLAILLLALRAFSAFVQGGARLVGRLRAAPPMLALTRLARAPRHAIRLTLLLAVATIYSIFLLTFTASQTQRVADVAAYQVGADFSGTLPDMPPGSQTPTSGVAALAAEQLQVQNMLDRRAIMATLQHEPFYLTLTGTATFSVILPLTLAFLGTLLASWVYLRRELTSFVALRALGATPRQLRSILVWEQSLAFGTALALGVGLGLPLALTLVPNVIYSNAGTGTGAATSIFFTLQHIPAIQVVVPGSVTLVVALLLAAGLGEILLLTRFATRTSISQTLRLNDD
jgi:ABC-type lipoprotein release transport system permease subunit